jgi:predicted nucleic acid-binding protein
MAEHRLRVALDANVLIAGILLPRWPHEVMRAALARTFDLVLPEQVVVEARRHLPRPEQQAALDYFLANSACEIVPRPPPPAVSRHHDLVRSAKDVPVALAVLAGGADVLVTSDKDFTDPEATAQSFRDRVRVMLPAVFLKEVLGWDSERLEAIRGRTWSELT